MAFFANIFGYLLNFIYNLVKNYGVAIIIFSIVVKLVMIPISIKQQKTMKKSIKLQSKMKEIQFKYKNNPEKLNRETMELYKSENMSPFSGCLSAIVQLILLFAVFFLVKSPLTYMKKVDASVIEKYTTIMQQNNIATNSGYPEIELIREIDTIKDLKNTNINNNEEQTENTESAENAENKLAEINDEELESLRINMDFLGLNLAQVPTRSSDWKAYIIPVLYVIVAILSTRLINSTNQVKTENKENKEKSEGEDDFDPMVQMNKNMNLMFPIMYVIAALLTPLGLALYWLMNSFLMIIEKLILNKLLKDEEEN